MEDLEVNFHPGHIHNLSTISTGAFVKFFLKKAQKTVKLWWATTPPFAYVPSPPIMVTVTVRFKA